MASVSGRLDERNREGRGDDQRSEGNELAPKATRLGHLLGLERRELRLEALDVELEEPFGTIDVLEPVRPQLADRDAADLVLDELARRVREQHLAAMSHRPDPRGAVHPEPDIVVLV